MNSRGFKTRQFGKYTLLERIGAGGMAEIYRAKMYGAHGFEKEVAIKRILPNLTDDAEFVEMFVDEAKITVGLVHNNIVQVFDLGDIEGQYFIGMEYIHGKDLLDLLARCAEMQLKVPLKLGVFIVMEMLKGLDYAHKAADMYGTALNIIHRDVSPSNVLLSYAGDVKVGDFGVAKAASQRSTTEIGTLKGKVGYMSPEQVRGDKIDHRSDLFAGGIILFEILNMRRLFIGGSDLDVMLRVRDVDIHEELKNSIPLPADLKEIVVKALARDANQRYQHSQELHDALMDFLYRNRVQVTNKDLASFLGRVFQKEIEQDKLKRLQFREKEAEIRAKAIASSRGMPAISPEALAAAAPATPAPDPTPAPESDQFRFRDKSGLVFGPMSAATLTNLLVSTPVHDEDRVSQNNGNWVKLEDVPDVYDQVLSERKKQGKVGTEHDPTPGSGHFPAIQQAPVVTETGSGTSPVPESGSLDDTPFSSLLFRIARSRARGCLTVREGTLFKSIYFTNGNPASVSTNSDTELLGNFLVREGILSQAQLETALERAKIFGGRLGDALVADRVIQSHVLFEYLFRQAKLKMFDIFTWESGDFEYANNASPAQPAYPLGIDTLEVILEGVKRYVPAKTLVRYFQDFRFAPLVPADDAETRLDELRLTAKQFRVATAAISGNMNLDSIDRQLTAAQKIQMEDIHRTIYLLEQLELLTFRT